MDKQENVIASFSERRGGETLYKKAIANSHPATFGKLAGTTSEGTLTFGANTTRVYPLHPIHTHTREPIQSNPCP
jgi:hypothetical protein